MNKKLIMWAILAVAIAAVAIYTIQNTMDNKVMTIEDDTSVMEKTGYVDISVVEAKVMIDTKPELIIIDVSPNYARGHLPRAINYYAGDGSLDRAIPTLDSNAEYLVYCHVDSVSILGAQKLVDAGFKNVYRLEGNYKAWIDAGYPVEN